MHSHDRLSAPTPPPRLSGRQPPSGAPAYGHCIIFTNICGSSSVGRASASQAEGREFEPRLPLPVQTSENQLFIPDFQRFLFCIHIIRYVKSGPEIGRKSPNFRPMFRRFRPPAKHSSPFTSPFPPTFRQQHCAEDTVRRPGPASTSTRPPLSRPPAPLPTPPDGMQKNERLLIGPRKRGRLGGAICFANRSANARGCQDLRAGCIGWLSRISLPLCSGCCRRWATAWRWRRAAGSGRTHRYMSRSDADSAGRT